MPYQMNDVDLYQYFYALDIDSVDDKHYMHTRNLMIDRGMIECEQLKLTSIEDMKEYFESEIF